MTSFCPYQFLRKLFAMPYAALAIAAASAGSLVAASVLQTVFKVEPCILCLFQRGPYAVALILALAALVFRKKQALMKTFMALAGVAFLVNVGIATFHSGVEREWWTGTDSCAVTPMDGDTSGLSFFQMMMTAIGECNKITFDIFGLSLANLNVFFCLALAAVAFSGAFGLVKQRSIEDCPLCAKVKGAFK